MNKALPFMVMIMLVLFAGIRFTLNGQWWIGLVCVALIMLIGVMHDRIKI